MIRLGIDTGGTFTDAVIVDMDGPHVLAKAKSLTTKGDLSRCIGSVLDALPDDMLAQAQHAALSTTLATNACVEGKGGRAKLVIVGTSEEVLHRVDAQGVFGIPYSDVLTVEYIGSYDGTDVQIPDWEALYTLNRSFFDEAESFGIASVYSRNNGAVVEKSGATFLRERFGKLVVEATSVAAEPNVIARGATALLNARLVPVISDFLDAVEHVFSDRHLDMPISIVRSDGSLMSEELARVRPVETILSGPAASVTGAQALADASESLVVDIGGTTSDISIVHGGRPNRTDGIAIGGWKTQVAGVSIDTIALGGDTVVRYTKNSKLELGSRRVTPLCIASSRWPQIKPALRHYLSRACSDFHSQYEFLYLMRNPGDLTRFTKAERLLIDLLRDGPVSLFDDRTDIVGLKTKRLEDEGIIMRCGLTPTDAMHLKGDFDGFDAEASRLGAQCVLKSYRGKDFVERDDAIEGLADEIYDLAQFRLFEQVVGAFSQDRYWPEGNCALDAQMHAVTRSMWETRADGRVRSFDILLRSDATLVGVGAPTHVFVNEVARVLQAPCIVPAHSEVANAIGAAASRVAVEQTVRVAPLRGSDGVVQGYYVHAAESSEFFEDVDDAVAAARDRATGLAMAEAHRRGASDDVTCELSEDRQTYHSTGTMDLVRSWTITALVS